MSWLKVAGRTVLLGALSFALAAAVGATNLPDFYALSVVVSVILCPALLGFIGGRGLKLSPAATLLGINFLPVVMALDARFHLGEPGGFGWLLASFLFAFAGWRLGRLPRRKS
ncbi:MAG TPA: hypothetical protein VN915_04545 [Elusimicrobiota bacterium]|nr:hypothetical protein [Elusimicrobiota bacterium]